MTPYDLVLTNAHLATMQGDEPYGMIPHGAIAVKDGRIASVGPANAVSAKSADHVVDLGGRWVTPGLIDCHTHIVYAGNRAHEFEMRLKAPRTKQLHAPEVASAPPWQRLAAPTSRHCSTPQHRAFAGCCRKG